MDYFTDLISFFHWCTNSFSFSLVLLPPSCTPSSFFLWWLNLVAVCHRHVVCRRTRRCCRHCFCFQIGGSEANQRRSRQAPRTILALHFSPINATSKNSNLQAEEFETDSEESDVSGSDGDDTSWISWFCNLRGNEFFCDVDD